MNIGFVDNVVWVILLIYGGVCCFVYCNKLIKNLWFFFRIMWMVYSLNLILNNIVLNSGLVLK